MRDDVQFFRNRYLVTKLFLFHRLGYFDYNNKYKTDVDIQDLMIGKTVQIAAWKWYLTEREEQYSEKKYSSVSLFSVSFIW